MIETAELSKSDLQAVVYEAGLSFPSSLNHYMQGRFQISGIEQS